MNTKTHAPESPDSKFLAYGKQVEQLFELNTPSEMAEHLWEMYSGFQYYEEDSGENPRKLNIFYTFRELLSFCKKIQELMPLSPRAEARGN